MAKRALCIGINDYPGTYQDLSGCVNDANDWQAELEKRGFDVTSLLDSAATKQNMKDAIRGMVDATGASDILVITYSGHGTWVPDADGDEADGRDEALCPYDMSSGGVLTDDELYEIFSQRKYSARIIFLSDSCHSGSVARMAMPQAKPFAEEKWNFQKVKFMPPAFHLTGPLLEAAKRVERVRATSRIRAATVLFSGCQDHEYSYDAWFNGRANGAFTYVALWVLKQLPPDATYWDWHRAIRQYLPHTYYPQSPQFDAAYYQRKWKIFEE
jgi:hypothetical protein